MEKNRRNDTRYIIDLSEMEKKEKKLDWMYKGPNEMINREEYLLGKPVDKAFEEMAQVEKEIELNRAPKNHVEYGKITLHMHIYIYKLSRNVCITLQRLLSLRLRDTFTYGD